MSNLREILIKVQEEETLKELLLDKYSEATEEQKLHYLSFLGDTINRGVDKLIREEVDNFNENTPLKKKNKNLTYLFVVSNVVLTILITYAVNLEAWTFVWGIGVLMVANLLLPLIFTDK
jgi:fatty-acid desaturase